MSKKEDNMIISYIRRSLLNLAKQFLCIIKKIEYKYQYKALLQLIGDEDFDVVNNSNEIPFGKKIIFIIPGMLTYIGGHISILRLGTILHRHGYEVTY